MERSLDTKKERKKSFFIKIDDFPMEVPWDLQSTRRSAGTTLVAFLARYRPLGHLRCPYAAIPPPLELLPLLSGDLATFFLKKIMVFENFLKSTKICCLVLIVLIQGGLPLAAPQERKETGRRRNRLGEWEGAPQVSQSTETWL